MFIVVARQGKLYENRFAVMMAESSWSEGEKKETILCKKQLSFIELTFSNCQYS